MNPRLNDRGAAPVDFVLVGSLVIVLFLGIVQLGLVLHVRSTAINAAGEGARLGARADAGPEEAAERTRALLGQTLTEKYAGDVAARRTHLDGVEAIEVSVRMPLPVVGLLGPGGNLVVNGHALAEPR